MGAECERNATLAIPLLVHAEHACIKIEAALEVVGRENDVIDTGNHRGAPARTGSTPGCLLGAHWRNRAPQYAPFCTEGAHYLAHAFCGSNNRRPLSHKPGLHDEQAGIS